jgi:hypothetical protein
LYTQVPKLGEVSEQEASAQSDSFAYGTVIVENEAVVLFCEGSEEVENVSSIFLTFFAPMWESKGCCCRCLVPGNEPIPSGFA